jgi:predicted GIY-YIG superfamily endonuclease
MKRGPQDVPGYVYLMQRADGLYKIGHSRKPRRRVWAIRYQARQKVWLVTQLPVCNALGVERAMQIHHAAKRVSGEWFALTRADADEFPDKASARDADRLEDKINAGQRRVEEQQHCWVAPHLAAAGWSLERLAQEAGITYRYMHRMRFGQRCMMSWDFRKKLAKALGVPAGRLG